MAEWLKLLKNTGLRSTMCEILAPAGDKNSAFAAINSGADAIYLGLKQFSARSSADNFGLDELKEIINYAVLFGVRVHVAMNTLVKQAETEDFINCAKAVWQAGADAIIIQDIFLGRAIKKACPQIVLHLSTQAGMCNEYGARLAAEFGFSRVILARETQFKDIEKIAKIIETEVFVQGALCTCFSGQCYLSSFAGGNSGNRGRCKQPCRKLYSIDRKGFEEKAYRISLSDLCAGENIIKLKDAGVYSFKIEGRMRRPEYVSAAVTYYKDILNGNTGAKSSDLSALKRTYNRGNYTRGLAFGQDKSFLSSAVQGHIGEYVGTVKVANGKFFCESAQKFVKGDGFKILRSGTELCGGVFDGEGKGGFYIRTSQRLKNGDKVFVTTDTTLNAALVSKQRTLSPVVSAWFEEGQFPRVSIDDVEYSGAEKLAAAESRPLSEEDITACFKKVGNLPLNVQFDKVCIKGRPYLGMGALNAFRRAAYEKFVSTLTFKDRNSLGANVTIPAPYNKNNSKTAVISTDLNGVRADIGILKLNSFDEDIKALTKDFSGEKFLFLPPFLSGDEVEKVKDIAVNFDGIYCDGFYGIVLARELNKPLFAGTGFNAANTFAAEYLKNNTKYYCISKELTLAESAPLRTENAFALYAGGIKVMDLVYCPFGRACQSCDKRRVYTLTDDAGRKFPLRRYETSVCRFELYNCANLLTAHGDFGALADFSVERDPVALSASLLEENALKNKLGKVTRGHGQSPVL